MVPLAASAGFVAILLEKRSIQFASAYVASHMNALRSILWEYPDGAPVKLLGDRHWLKLQAAWFAAVQATIIDPALDRGELVIADSWFYKLIARFAVKGPEQAAEATACFSLIRRPSVVFFLDVPATIAVERKVATTPAECGTFDHVSGAPREAFVTYQTRVHEELRRLCHTLGWCSVELRGSPRAIAEACIANLVQRSRIS